VPVLSTKGPIRGDWPDKYMVMLGVVLFVFMATFGGTLGFDALVALAMIFAGDFLEKRFAVDADDTDEPDDGEEDLKIARWVAATLVVFLALNLVVPAIPPSVSSAISSIQLSTVSTTPLDSVATVSRAFGVLIAIAEERFFRKAFGNVFISKSDPITGSVADGALFAVAHAAVYGDALTSIFVVFGAGIFMCYADYRTRRVSTSEICHVLNNVLV
jgi:membrane protease YdiL (CAAX protease family)